MNGNWSGYIVVILIVGHVWLVWLWQEIVNHVGKKWLPPSEGSRLFVPKRQPEYAIAYVKTSFPVSSVASVSSVSTNFSGKNIPELPDVPGKLERPPRLRKNPLILTNIGGAVRFDDILAELGWSGETCLFYNNERPLNRGAYPCLEKFLPKHYFHSTYLFHGRSHLSALKRVQASCATLERVERRLERPTHSSDDKYHICLTN